MWSTNKVVVVVVVVYFVLEHHSNSLLVILALEDVSGQDKLKKPVFCRYRKIPKISLSMYRPLQI